MIRPLTDFENWCAHATDENGQPYLSNLFVIVCSSDPDSFEEGKRILHACFEAGKQAGLNIPLHQRQVRSG